MSWLFLLVSVGICLLVGAACTDTEGADAGASTTSPVLIRPDPTPSEGCSSSQLAEVKTAADSSFLSNGVERKYNLTVPTDTSREPLPMVVNLHGATGTSNYQDAGSGFPALAQREGFVVLTPQALESAGLLWIIQTGGPDEQFINALIDETAAQLCVDLSRVYLAGFSMGGMIAMRMACDSPERFAAIGVVAGLIDTPCRRTMPVPAVAFQGTDDPTVRLDGTYQADIQLLLGGPSQPRDQIAAAWAQGNGCSDTSPTQTSNGPVEVSTYSCPIGADVRYNLIDGGTHTWPVARPLNRRPAGTSSADSSLDATEIMWNFFEGFQRSP